jgi:hypothetical protein
VLRSCCSIVIVVRDLKIFRTSNEQCAPRGAAVSGVAYTHTGVVITIEKGLNCWCDTSHAPHTSTQTGTREKYQNGVVSFPSFGFCGELDVRRVHDRRPDKRTNDTLERWHQIISLHHRTVMKRD